MQVRSPRIWRFAVMMFAFGIPFEMGPSAATANDTVNPPKVDLSQPNHEPVYSNDARAKNEHGDVFLAVYVETTGVPSKVNLDRTSGFDDLDQAAVVAVQRWHFVPATHDREPVPGWAKVRIHFQIPAASTGDQALAEDEARIICKKGVNATGTLIAPAKVCRPKALWDSIAAESQKNLEQAQQRSLVN